MAVITVISIRVFIPAYFIRHVFLIVFLKLELKIETNQEVDLVEHLTWISQFPYIHLDPYSRP